MSEWEARYREATKRADDLERNMNDRKIEWHPSKKPGMFQTRRQAWPLCAVTGGVGAFIILLVLWHG